MREREKRIAAIMAAVAVLTSCTAESASEPASVPEDVEVVADALGGYRLSTG